MTETAIKLPFMVKAEGSANVIDYGHDQKANELHVRYKGGGHYVYAEVPEAKYHEMLAAESVGGFLHREIRDKFKHRKL